MALETLMSGIRKAATEQNWDMAPFERVYKEIVKANYVNEWFWKKPIKSPSRKYSAQLFIQHEVQQIDFSIVIHNQDGEEIVRKKVLTEKPDEWNYSRHLGKLKWLDKDTVALINKNEDQQWSVTIDAFDA